MRKPLALAAVASLAITVAGCGGSHGTTPARTQAAARTPSAAVLAGRSPGTG